MNDQYAHPALDFLFQLNPAVDATFNIEHYTDLPKGTDKNKPDPLGGRHANLTLNAVEALLPKLESLNDQGAGIFVARNQCSGHRNEKNVSRILGVHADMDDVTAAQLASVRSVLEPSIVVESSSGRYQFYWQLSENEVLTKAETKAINQCLVARYGADAAAVDVSRLLRLPGFKHMKYRNEGRTPAVKVTDLGRTYTADEIRKAFPPVQTSKPSNKTLTTATQNSPGTSTGALQPSQLASVATTIANQYPHLWAGDWDRAVRSTGEIGYPSQSEADLALAGHISRAFHKLGVDESTLPDLVEAVFSNSPLGQSDKWQGRPDYRTRTISKVISSLNAFNAYGATSGLVLESYGDVLTSKAFAQIARGEFIYVATRDKWLRWHQGRWQLAEKEEQIGKAKEVCTLILDAASAQFAQDQERGKKLIQTAVGAHSLPRILAMLKLAVSEPDMATTDRELDSNPYLLGVQNGIVDLKTGHYLFNEPKYLITRYCNAAFEEDATCPKWLRFLDQIFESDTDTIDAVKRLLGCTLLGLADEEILVICYGHGSNGKSVFSNVVHRIMGGYSTTAPSTLLISRRQDDTGPRNDLAALAGARYVSINELQAGDRLDEQVVKMLAGREPISARFLHQEFFEFEPSFTPWLRTNHKPIITGEDDGIWRRLVILRFGRKFTDAEKNPHLEQELLEEQNGILMWMIEGAKQYQRHGICMSPRMKAELATYRTDSDLLGEFLADYTTPDPAAKANQGTLYNYYISWSKDSGVRPLSKKSFTQRLAERGFPEGKTGNNRFYAGLKLGVSPTPSSQGEVDSLDRIMSNSGNSLHEKFIEEKTPNSPTSCPTRPDNTVCKEKADA
jgi:putative DNA primase/helicase